MFWYAQVVRSPLRFARKYWAAQLLSSRLFGGERAVNDTQAEIQQTSLWRSGDKLLQDLFNMESKKLQCWVRASWIHDGVITKNLKNLVASLVTPCLNCSLHSIPDNLSDVMARFTAIISGANAEDGDVTNLKLACSALKGDLQAHPLVCGLALQCRRQVEKLSRGITTMRGRRSREGAQEKALISDAGLSLAIHGGNLPLARQFGLAAAELKIDVDELNKHSLPTPCLAVCWPNVLEENWRLCDQRFVRDKEAPRRDLADCIFGYFLMKKGLHCAWAILGMVLFI